ncbi:uncharacterized protein LOC135929961 isoform X2 [Gordionus sp. m RMFG-2023]|uniref:uncharacterized protein LOC135929961 isoform X2 n=1 Tax=Gordionus sp. m RMFG-2023 TaxID=3053472 RepID=UPI0031FD3D8F
MHNFSFRLDKTLTAPPYPLWSLITQTHPHLSKRFSLKYASSPIILKQHSTYPRKPTLKFKDVFKKWDGKKYFMAKSGTYNRDLDDHRYSSFPSLARFNIQHNQYGSLRRSSSIPSNLFWQKTLNILSNFKRVYLSAFDKNSKHSDYCYSLDNAINDSKLRSQLINMIRTPSINDTSQTGDLGDRSSLISPENLQLVDGEHLDSLIMGSSTIKSLDKLNYDLRIPMSSDHNRNSTPIIEYGTNGYAQSRNFADITHNIVFLNHPNITTSDKISPGNISLLSEPLQDCYYHSDDPNIKLDPAPNTLNMFRDEHGLPFPFSLSSSHCGQVSPKIRPRAFLSEGHSISHIINKPKNYSKKRYLLRNDKKVPIITEPFFSSKKFDGATKSPLDLNLASLPDSINENRAFIRRQSQLSIESDPGFRSSELRIPSIPGPPGNYHSLFNIPESFAYDDNIISELKDLNRKSSDTLEIFINGNSQDSTDDLSNKDGKVEIKNRSYPTLTHQTVNKVSLNNTACNVNNNQKRRFADAPVRFSHKSHATSMLQNDASSFNNRFYDSSSPASCSILLNGNNENTSLITLTDPYFPPVPLPPRVSISKLSANHAPCPPCQLSIPNRNDNQSPCEPTFNALLPTISIATRSLLNSTGINLPPHSNIITTPTLSSTNSSNSLFQMPCDNKKYRKTFWDVLAPSYKSRNEDFKKLFMDETEENGNGIENERLLVDYSCALQKEILIQGRMYISQSYVCFYANIFRWESKIKIRFKDVLSVSKEKLAKIIPNALTLQTQDGSKYTFASFTSRDKTYLALFRAWQNALLGHLPLPAPELWHLVHESYGNELGLTSDDDDYVDPRAVEARGLDVLETSQSEINCKEKHYDLLTSRGNLADSKTRVKSSPEFSSQRYSQGIKNYPSPPNSILQQPLADILKNQSGEISFSSTKHIPLNNRSPVTFLSDTNSELLISDSIQNGGSKEYINISNGPIEGDSSANIYSTEDDEKLGPEEGEGDTISCLCSEHPGKLYLDLIINNKSCDEVFQLLFTNSHFFRNIQKERNTKSLVMSEWGSSNENMTSNKLSTSQHHNHNLNHHHEKYSKHHIDSHASKKKRVLSYVVEISSPLGTKSAPTTEKQILIVGGESSLRKWHRRRSKRYVVECEVTNSGVPYSDAYYVICRYCLTRVGGEKDSKACRLTVHCLIGYKKSVFSLVKSIIEKNCQSGLQDYFKFLGNKLISELRAKSITNEVSDDVVSQSKTNKIRKDQQVPNELSGNKSNRATKTIDSGTQDSRSSKKKLLLCLYVVYLNYKLWLLEDFIIRSQDKGNESFYQSEFRSTFIVPLKSASFITFITTVWSAAIYLPKTFLSHFASYIYDHGFYKRNSLNNLSDEEMAKGIVLFSQLLKQMEESIINLQRHFNDTHKFT